MATSHPQGWTSFAGPADWYAAAYPPGWELGSCDGVPQLTAPGGAGVLTLKCFWLSDGQLRAFDPLAEVNRMFPCCRRLQRFSGADGEIQSTAFKGEAVIDGNRSQRWWQRVFGRRLWRQWRVWFLRRDRVCLSARYMDSGSGDLELANVAAMIVGTVCIADEPSDPPAVFTERVLELAQSKFPLLECKRTDDLQLTLGGSSVNLFNFYRSYLNAPDRFEEIVLPALTTVVQVQGWGTSQTEPELSEVRDRIMPMLYPESVWKEKFPNFVGTEWVAGLAVLYVVDESQAYWYIRDDLLEAWNLTTGELHELAVANLDSYFESHQMEFTVVGEEDGPKLLAPVKPDAYNSSRLLSETFLAKLRSVLGNQFAAGLPNRDFLVAVSLDVDEMVDHVRSKVEDDYRQMDHPLTDELLLVTPDGVTKYLPNW